MARNIEIKARVADPARLEAAVIPLATEGPIDIQQEDTFFHTPVGRLKLRCFADGTGELIYYERPDTPDPSTSSYSRYPTSDPASL